jgi:serine/threonine protein kinase
MATSGIPSIADIKAASNVLSPSDSSAKVVRIKDMLIKFSARVSLVEGANLEFLATQTKVPVPRFIAAFSEPGTLCNYIVMEFILGPTQEEIWPSLSTAEQSDIVDQLKTAPNELHSIPLPSPAELGSIHRQPLTDGVFWNPRADPAFSGPFSNELDFNEAILRRLGEDEPEAHLKLLRTLISTSLRDHKMVYTHADLQLKNIMVQRMGEREDGSRIFEIKLIDWEISGWYPEYWEFVNATICGRFRPYWLDVAQSIFPLYSTEYLTMQYIRSLLFY